MATAVIVDAVRTPLGSATASSRTSTRSTSPPTCCATLVERNDLDPALIDDVIMGCVMQVGEQGSTSAATPRSPPASPSRCPAPRSTASAARRSRRRTSRAQGVIAGAYDIVIAAGVEVMTRVPMGASVADGKSASRSARR